MGESAGRRGGVLDIRGAAYVLRVRPADMLRALKCDDLPARRVGGEWRFEREALKRWVASGSSSRQAAFPYRLTTFNVAHREGVDCWQI